MKSKSPSLPAALKPHRIHALLAACFIALAIVLGGGGSPNPAAEMLLGLVAVLAALIWIWLPGPLRLPSDKRLWLLALLVAIVPAMQLVPLPPSVWSALPGRDLEASSLDLIGAADTWRPISTSPMRTLASLLSLIPPLLIMLMTGALDPRGRRWVIVAIAAMVIVSALLGATQLSEGNSAFSLYGNPHRIVVGFQANRNATADIMLIGIVALAALGADILARGSQSSRRKLDPRILWLAGAGLVLVLACILTASRAGIGLLIPTLLAGTAILFTGRMRGWRRMLPGLALAAFAIFVVTLLLVQNNTALQKVAGRFTVTDDPRLWIWTETLVVIEQYWPVGSGMGTFVPSFLAIEPLDLLVPAIANRAHNDYLELAVEAGLFGIVALLLAVATLAVMALRGWKSRREDRVQIGFATAVLMIIAAHSLVDYPLRSMSLASLAAVAAGLLCRTKFSPLKPKTMKREHENQTDL